MKRFNILMFALMACCLMCAGWSSAQEANQLQLPDDVFFIAKAKSIDHLQSQIEELLVLVGQPNAAPAVKQSFAEAYGVNALDTIDGTKEVAAILVNPMKFNREPIVLVGSVKNKQKYIEALQANNEMALENNVYKLTGKSGGEAYVVIKDTLLFYGKMQEPVKKISEWPNLNQELASMKLKGDAGLRVFVPRINAALGMLLTAQIAQTSNQLKQLDQPADPEDQMAQFRDLQKGMLTMQLEALNFSSTFLKESKALEVDLDLGKDKQLLDVEYEAVANGNFAQHIAKNQMAPTSLIKYFPKNTCLAASGRINPETQGSFLKWYANFVSMIPTAGQKEAEKKMVKDMLNFTIAQTEFLGGESGAAAFSNDKGEGLSALAVYELKNPDLAKKSIESLKNTIMQMAKEKDAPMEVKYEANLSDPSGIKFDKYTITPAKNENFEKNMATYAKVCKNFFNTDKIAVYSIIQNNYWYIALGGQDAFAGAKSVMDNVSKKQLVLGKEAKFTTALAQLHPNANVYYYVSIAEFMKPFSKAYPAIDGKALPFKFNEQSPALGISCACDAAKVKMRIMLPGQVLKDIADAILSAEQARPAKVPQAEEEGNSDEE